MPDSGGESPCRPVLQRPSPTCQSGQDPSGKEVVCSEAPTSFRLSGPRVSNQPRPPYVCAMVPRVSVCIPTYNGAAFLAETLDSAVAQTFDDFEVVIVDDCSTDESFDIAERFARSDPRVRAIRNAERAGSGAANAKVYLAHARGEWIKTLNQDDLMAPTCLARMLDASARGPLVICWHDFRFESDVDPVVRAMVRDRTDARHRAARRLRRRGRRLCGGAAAAVGQLHRTDELGASSIATASRNMDRSIRRFRSSPTSTSGLASAAAKESP